MRVGGAPVQLPWAPGLSASDSFDGKPCNVVHFNRGMHDFLVNGQSLADALWRHRRVLRNHDETLSEYMTAYL